MAVPDGAHAPSAAGEDGALLAQPLRHRLQQGRRRLRRGPRHEDDGRAGAELRRRLPRPGAVVPGSRHRQLPRSAGRSGKGPGDAGVARWPHQRPCPPPGELRARADGAVHHGHRSLHRSRRLRGGPGLHGLEPRADGRTRQRAGELLPVHLQPEPARPDREGIHVRDLSRRGPHDPSASRRAGHAGRPGSDRRAGAPSRDGPPPGDAGSINTSSTTSMRRTRHSSTTRRRPTCPATTASRRCCSACCSRNSS